MSTVLRFSKKDRAAIAKQVIGKPTDVTVELGGMTISLVPITTAQADEIFDILDAFGKLGAQADKDGMASLNQTDLASMVPREGKRIKKVLRSYLFESAKASDLIDDCDDIFDEWFGSLPLLETVRTMLPKIVEAQGLGTMLGNSSTLPAEPESEAVLAGTASQ